MKEKYNNLSEIDIKRISSFNLKNTYYYLNVINKCNSNIKGIIIDYLNPIDNYIDKDKYHYYILKFKDELIKKFSLIEYAINNNKFDIINKLFYIKRIIIENPIKDKSNINEMYKYFDKYCKTFKNQKYNNDILRAYIISLIENYSIKENELFDLVNKI